MKFLETLARRTALERPELTHRCEAKRVDVVLDFPDGGRVEIRMDVEEFSIFMDDVLEASDWLRKLEVH